LRNSAVLRKSRTFWAASAFSIAVFIPASCPVPSAAAALPSADPKGIGSREGIPASANAPAIARSPWTCIWLRCAGVRMSA
jgi:hypothetical protein